MTEQIDSLVLEHLRHIRSRVDQIADDVGDLKQRMSGLESGMNLVKREVVQGDEIDARQQITLDKFSHRADRARAGIALSRGK